MTITNSTSAPLVVVTGSTGNQGGSIIAHLASSKREYRVRALTRDPEQAKALALKEKGVEVVKVDSAQVHEVTKAFAGANIVYAMTDFWSHGTKSGDVRAGSILADAAKASSVSLFIWSGAHDVSAGSGGRLTHAEHFDSKSAVLKYAREIGLNVLNIEPACFISNWLTYLKPVKPNADVDEYVYPIPLRGDVLMPYFDVNSDLGDWVVTAIELPDNERPKEILTGGEWVSHDEIVKHIAKVTGKNVKYHVITPEEYEKTMLSYGVPEAAVKDFSEMWQWYDHFGYYGGDKVTELKGRQHATTTVEEYFNRKEVVETLKSFF